MEKVTQLGLMMHCGRLHQALKAMAEVRTGQGCGVKKVRGVCVFHKI